MSSGDATERGLTALCNTCTAAHTAFHPHHVFIGTAALDLRPHLAVSSSGSTRRRKRRNRRRPRRPMRSKLQLREAQAGDGDHLQSECAGRATPGTAVAAPGRFPFRSPLAARRLRQLAAKVAAGHLQAILTLPRPAGSPHRRIARRRVCRGAARAALRPHHAHARPLRRGPAAAAAARRATRRPAT